MKTKIFLALCVTLLSVSCGDGSGTGGGPITPPIIGDRLSGVTVKEDGSAVPVQMFRASYDDGKITNMVVSGWEGGGVTSGEKAQRSAFALSKSLVRFMPIAVYGGHFTKSIESSYAFDTTVKYEKSRIILEAEEDGEKIKIVFNLDKKGRAVSMNFKSDYGEMKIMDFSYNSDGQLSEYEVSGFYSDGEREYVLSVITSLKYSGGSISSAIQRITEDNKIVDQVDYYFEKGTVKNSQGVFPAFLDSSGFLTALSTLDVIGNKTVNLPEKGSVEIKMIDGFPPMDIPGLSITVDMEYGVSPDGYLNNILYTMRASAPYVEPEEMIMDFGFTFEK